ncbi:MAG: NRDE family protein [Bryobacteraceae bacterium]
MCTVSWALGANGYHLLCNRDEKRSRARATPPCVRTESNLQVIAPRDPVGGGTWIASNSRGISVALLNGCNLGEEDGGPSHMSANESRGRLPARLIRFGTVEATRDALEAMRLAAFLPFTVLILAPGEPAHLFAWNGREKRILTDDSAHGLVCSSSHDPQGVRRYRHAAFDSLRRQAKSVNPDLLFWFHESHGKSPGAYSTCMHRPDAETVSFSWIRVDSAEVEFFYTPSSPCRWLPGTTRRAPRME